MSCTSFLAGEGRPVLDWPRRVKIAAGAARGIAYLHEDCKYSYLHIDCQGIITLTLEPPKCLKREHFVFKNYVLSI